MLHIVKDLVEEFAGTLIRPRIEKAKTDLKLALVTAAVIVVFSLLALVCLYVVIFLHLAETMTFEKAALALFGFSIFMCVGAMLMFLIGRRVEQALYERRLDGPLRRGRSARHEDDHEEIDIASYVHDLFADNKGAALIAASVAGILLGAKPGMVLHGLKKIVVGAGKRRYRGRY